MQPTPTIDLRLVPAALAAWAVTAASIVWECGPEISWTAAIITMTTAGLLIRRRNQEAPKSIYIGLTAAALVATGFGIAASLRTEAIQNHPIAKQFGTAAIITAVPTESPRSVSGGWLLLRATLSTIDGANQSGRVTIFASSPSFGQVAPGQRVHFRARISRPTRHDLTIAVLTAQGEATTDQTNKIQRAAMTIRENFATKAHNVLPTEQAAMLPGLVLGDTSMMTPTAVAEFKAAGLTHLTAVSGANVTIVCGTVLLSAALVGPRIAVGLAALTLIAFVIVVQPSASVLRAATMGAVTLLALLTSRRRQAIPALSACVIALMMLAPHLAVDVGFALSVTATAALIVLAPIWSARLVERGWPKLLADALCVCAAAQLVTAPLVAAISGQFSLIAIVANMAVTAVIAPITILGTAAAALCVLWPSAAELLIRFTGPELWWVRQSARTAANLPGAAITVPSGFAGFATVTAATLAAIVLWRRSTKRNQSATHGTIVR